MSDLFTTILISFSRLLFSSRALALMANRTSSKALHTSKAEPQPRNDTVTNSPSKEEISPSDDDSLCSDRSENLNFAQQGCPCSSFSSSTQSLVLNMPLAREELDSPTLVPCNSPALSPSHSLVKVSHVTTIFHNAHSGQDFSSHTSNPASECLSPETSSFNISLVSDTSEEDEDFHLPSSLDSALFPSGFEVPQRSSLTPSRRNIGLGISGLLKKDGTTPFDGLGLVSIRASDWRTASSSLEDHISDSDYQQANVKDPRCSSGYGSNTEMFSLATIDSTEKLSSTFLEEALLTFAEDPFHINSELGPIPECRSWYELDDLSRRASPVHSEVGYDMINQYHDSEVSHQLEASTANPKPRHLRRTNFSSATISSELKRSVSSGSNLKKTRTLSHLHLQCSRPRSTTWPTSISECSDPSRGHGMGRGVAHRSSVMFGRGTALRRTWRI